MLKAYLVFANAVRVEFRGQDTRRFLSKRIDASGLSTAQRERISADINDAAFFSAKVSDAKLLERMQSYIAGAAADKRGLGRADFITRMREAMGIAPITPVPGKSLEDITSSRRLGLIYDFQRERMDAEILLARGSDPDHAWAYPALELVRKEARMAPRDWRERWRDAGGKLYAGRMIALRDDPVWQKISRFGSPTPPFDFNSGMGLSEISITEAERLGVIKPGERPAGEPVSFQGSAEVPKNPQLPSHAIDKSIVMPEPLSKAATVGQARKYISELLGKNRPAEIALASDAQARAVAQSMAFAKQSGLLDAAGVSRIEIVDKLKDRRGTYAGEIDLKTGAMRLSLDAFDKNGGLTTPIHEVVHMFNWEIETNPKLFDELNKMWRGYIRKAKGYKGGRRPPLASDTEEDRFEFLSEVVAYYLCGNDIEGYGKRAFDLLRKVVRMRGK
ncbi:MAG: hypothetical protein E7037_01640 [Verrucomicrobia bacterium]|nr:hypothetical protein [Verrucomicrobiota bacterium]